mmetsp:Transcript_76201/g.215631  ORF Transcript_76201/g.215631 Transcript_76201/m.215631 type:complete len:213 (-) Transcript_76201:283-921(-)
MVLQYDAQAPREKDAVRVHLDCPGVVLEHPRLDEILPDCHENVCIGNLPVPVSSALEARVDGGDRPQAAGNLKLAVAVHDLRVAREEARPLLELQRHQVPLVAVRQDQGEAEERSGHGEVDLGGVAGQGAAGTLDCVEVDLKVVKACVLIETRIPVWVFEHAVCLAPHYGIITGLPSRRCVASRHMGHQRLRLDSGRCHGGAAAPAPPCRHR